MLSSKFLNSCRVGALYMSIVQFVIEHHREPLAISPKPAFCFRNDKIVLEESRGTKSWSLFHTFCCHNQLDNVSVGKDCSSIS